MANNSFSSGFGTGLQLGNIRNQRRQLELEKQKAEQKALKDHFNEFVNVTKETTQAYIPQLYSEDPAVREKAQQSFRQARAQLFSAFQEFGQAALQSGKLTEPDLNKAYQIMTIAGNPIDPRAAQDLEARGEGMVAGAKSDAKQENELEKIRARTAGQIEVRKTPTTETIYQGATEGQASPMPDVDEVGRGVELMEDIRQSSGAKAAISKGISRTAGQVIPGTNPRLDAESRVMQFNQEIKAAFTRNPRFPVHELQKIEEELLPEPKAIFTDPEAEARKIPLLRDHLINLNKVDERTLQGALSKKGRNDAIDRMATRQAVIDLIGEVPEYDAEQEIEDLESMPIEEMTDDEKRRYLELIGG